MINLIIGKNSFVTKSNIKYTKNNIILSLNKLDKHIIKNTIKKKKINLIINGFYPSKFLNNLNDKNYQDFLDLTLEKLLILLKNIPRKQINKIIYTSSSAVYRILENFSLDEKDRYNRDLYSVFKLAAEKLIANYAEKKKIKYYICRLFNTYGNNQDRFSLIEKLIRIKKKKSKLTLINEGSAIRDFVHLNDVARIYNIFVTKNVKPGTYDIGTGKGFLIKELVESLNIPNNKINKINNISEIKTSIADTTKLLEQIGNFKFQKLENYIIKKLHFRNKKKIKPLSNLLNANYSAPGVIIYGAGFAGKKIFFELQKERENILFFVDDNSKIHDKFINGTPVISYDKLLKIRENLNIKRVYLSIPSLNQSKLNSLINKIRKNFFDVRFLPEKKFLLSDQININDININIINYILNRKPIKIKKLKNLTNKNILVTGACGTIGSEICRQLLQQGIKKIIALDKTELSIYNLKKNLKNKKLIFKLVDINDSSIVENIIKKEKINQIFHTAAYKHVNILEDNIFSAFKNNVIATFKLCELAIKFKCNMTFISTDKAADPKSILGYTKRVAEKICENFNHKTKTNKFISVVRFGNVFGSSGSAITNFIDQINNNLPVEITNVKASRYFMTILEACNLVLQTTQIGKLNSIFVLNMGKPINIFSLVKKLVKFKLNINPNYIFKYKEIGLKAGEKLHEKIVSNKEIQKKYNKDIYLVRSKFKNKKNFFNYYNILLNFFDKNLEKKLFNCLKKINSY